MKEQWEESIEMYRALDLKGYLRKFTSDNVRPDGRPLHAARPTTIVKGVLPRNSYGSSLVRLGETQVLAAITLQIGTPGAGSPDRGDLELRLTVGPVCSGRYDLGGRIAQTETSLSYSASVGGGGSGCGGDPESVESLVQRTVRSSGVVDWTQLCIERGRSAWRIRIGLMALNHDGNLEDACLLAATAALTDLRLPRTRVQGDGTVRIIPGPDPNDCSKGGTRLRIRGGKVPIPLTVGVFEGVLLVDPTAEEEAACGGSVTAVVNTEEEVLGLTKLGADGLKARELAACVTLAFGRAKELGEVVLTEQAQEL